MRRYIKNNTNSSSPLSSSSTNIFTSPSTALSLLFILHLHPTRPITHRHLLPSPNPPRIPHQQAKTYIPPFSIRPLCIIRRFGFLGEVHEIFLPNDERRHLHKSPRRSGRGLGNRRPDPRARRQYCWGAGIMWVVMMLVPILVLVLVEMDMVVGRSRG